MRVHVYTCVCVCALMIMHVLIIAHCARFFLIASIQLVQAKLAEKLGGLIFDGLRTRFHATRALVYLGHLDMVKMSLFDPYPSDGDSVLWSDESFSSTARYARLVPSPPVMKYVLFLWVGLVGVATGAFTVVLSSSVGSDFIDAHPPCWAIVLYQGCTIHTCIAVAMDDLCWTVLCPLLCAQLPFVTFCYVSMVMILTCGTTFLDIHI